MVDIDSLKKKLPRSMIATASDKTVKYPISIDFEDQQEVKIYSNASEDCIIKGLAFVFVDDQQEPELVGWLERVDSSDYTKSISGSALRITSHSKEGVFGMGDLPGSESIRFTVWNKGESALVIAGEGVENCVVERGSLVQVKNGAPANDGISVLIYPDEKHSGAVDYYLDNIVVEGKNS